MYARKETLLSSRIESTQSSLSDLPLYENNMAPGTPIDNVVEVSSTYVGSLNHGLQRMAAVLRSQRASFERYRAFFWRQGAAARNSRVSSGRRKARLAAPARATHFVYARKKNFAE